MEYTIMSQHEPAECDEDPYIYPPKYFQLSNAWDLINFGFVMPMCYIGTFLSCVIIVKILKVKRSIPDVLIALITCNEFLLVVMVFTPTMLAYSKKQWFGKQVCIYHAFFNSFFLLNEFFIIVFMAIERYWAIVTPFYYARYIRLRTIFIIVGCLTFVSCIIAVFPSFTITVTLMPGWYCTFLSLSLVNTTRKCYADDDALKSEIFFGFLYVVFLFGLIITMSANHKVIIALRRKKNHFYTYDLTLEEKMIRMIQILCVTFHLAWTPHLVSIRYQ